MKILNNTTAEQIYNRCYDGRDFSYHGPRAGLDIITGMRIEYDYSGEQEFIYTFEDGSVLKLTRYRAEVLNEC